MRKVYLRKHSTIYWNNTEPGLSQGGNGKCFISHSILEFMRTTLSLDLDERDQLKELLNIGVSHAGTKLSQMAGRRVAISVPQVSVERAETVATLPLLEIIRIGDGEVARIHRVRFAQDESTHPDCAVYRRGPWGKHGGGVNRIISFVETDMGGGSAYYEQRCRLEAAEG